MVIPHKIAVTQMELDPGMAWGTVTQKCTLRISTISNPHCPPDAEGNPQAYETKAFLGTRGNECRDELLTRYAITGEQALAGHRAMFIELMSVIGTSITFVEAIKRLKSMEDS